MTSAPVSPILFVRRQYPVWEPHHNNRHWCNIINLANKSQHSILYIYKEHYGWLAESSLDSVHICSSVYDVREHQFIVDGNQWSSRIKLSRYGLRFYFLWNCSLNEALQSPSTHTHSVQSNPAPPSIRLVLHSTCPDADVFNPGCSLATGCNSSHASLSHSLWNSSVRILWNRWVKTGTMRHRREPQTETRPTHPQPSSVCENRPNVGFRIQMKCDIHLQLIFVNHVQLGNMLLTQLFISCLMGIISLQSPG